MRMRLIGRNWYIASAVLVIFLVGYFLIQRFVLRPVYELNEHELLHRLAGLCLSVPKPPWVLFESRLTIGNDYVGLWKHPLGNGEIYVNLAEPTKQNPLTLAGVQRRTADKLKQLGFVAIGKSKITEDMYLFMRPDQQTAAVFIEQLPSSFILTMSVRSSIEQFPDFRDQWLAIVQNLQIIGQTAEKTPKPD